MQRARAGQIGLAVQHLVELVGIFPADVAKRDGGETLCQLACQLPHDFALRLCRESGAIASSRVAAGVFVMRLGLVAAVSAVLAITSAAGFARAQDAGPDSGMNAETKTAAA